MTPLGMAIGLGAQGGLVRCISLAHHLKSLRKLTIVNDERFCIYRWWSA
jgi:hypothetical protein